MKSSEFLLLYSSFHAFNAVNVASNGERFTLANATNLKTYIPSKINNKKKSHKGTYGSGKTLSTHKLLDINVTENVHSTLQQIDPARNLKKWKE
jgi:hypothetical protein